VHGYTDDGSLIQPYISLTSIAREVTAVKVMGWMFGLLIALLLALPVLLVVAIMLGPVVLGVLCAVGFGLIVFLIVNIVGGIGLAVEKTGAWIGRHSHASAPHA
jgi:hypothetical protein